MNFENLGNFLKFCIIWIFAICMKFYPKWPHKNYFNKKLKLQNTKKKKFFKKEQKKE